MAVSTKKEDIQGIQKDLEKLVQWANDWQMAFNYDKCKVMHLGSKSSGNSSYKMDGYTLQEIDEERDLGVLVTKDLKSGTQCETAGKKALKMLGIINRNVEYKSKDVMKKLYLAYVRPHLEHCVQAWNPYFQKDIDFLERVQRRATKMVNGLGALEYKDRLIALDLYSLKYRCLRGDLIETFKIIKGIDKCSVKNDFIFEGRHRGHQFNLYKSRSRTLKRQMMFTQRIVNHWNRLPSEVVLAPSLNIFKSRLDTFYSSSGLLFE